MVHCGPPGASVRFRTRLSLGVRRAAYPEAGNVGTTPGALILGAFGSSSDFSTRAGSRHRRLSAQRVVERYQPGHLTAWSMVAHWWYLPDAPRRGSAGARPCQRQRLGQTTGADALDK